MTLQKHKNTYTQSGFSLIELVVAVSIMLILAVVGFIAYQGLTDNARQAAVDGAANQVSTGVIAAHNTDDQDPVDVVRNYNASSEEIVTNITTSDHEKMIIQAVDTNNTLASLTLPGDYADIPTTTFSEPGVSYEWEGVPHASVSVKKLHGEVVARNLAQNPSFETNTNRYVRGNSVVEQSTEWSKSGEHSLHHVSDYTGGRGSAYLDVASSQYPRGLEHGKTYTVYAELMRKTDKNFGMLNGVNIDGSNDSMDRGTNGEQRLRGVFTVPEEHEQHGDNWYIRLSHLGLEGEEPIWWDNVMILEGDVEIEYFDGDSQ